jgi:hypothetical protein
MERHHRALPALALGTGVTWMAAVLLVAANPKGLSLIGDLAYDRANRVHTLALLFLLAMAVVLHRVIRDGDLPGVRAAKVLVVGAVLMLVGNVVSFWGALVVGQQSEQFWGGWTGWIIFLPGLLLLFGAPIALARAARGWPEVASPQRWAIGFSGVLLSITLETWAISPAATLPPAVLAAFALLALATAAGRVAISGVAEQPRTTATV